MALRKFTLDYGKGKASFSLPEEQVLCEVVGKPQPAVEFEAAYRRALEHPIDAPPLRELVRPGERVTIAVSDITRVWQRNDRLPEMRHSDAQGHRQAPGLAHPSDSPGEPCLTTPKREVRSSPW